MRIPMLDERSVLVVQLVVARRGRVGAFCRDVVSELSVHIAARRSSERRHPRRTGGQCQTTIMSAPSIRQSDLSAAPGTDEVRTLETEMSTKVGGRAKPGPF